MTSLQPKSPAEDMLPIEIGESRLSEDIVSTITWISPFRDQAGRVSESLMAETGCTLPDANRMSVSNGVRVISIGPGEALIFGAVPEIEGAALVDQSDGWAVFRLEGDCATDVLARLTSVDLRPKSFLVGHTARTCVGHMVASLSRLDAQTWEILVFRSMARSAVREISRAMQAVASRRDL